MLRSVANRFGRAEDVVRVEEYQPDPLGPGRVRLRMLLASVNPSDRVTIAGAYPSRTRLPFVPGFEGVGVVEDTGPGVASVRIGQRVLPLGSAGAWQDVKLADADWCVPVPAALSDEQAATGYINPLTAHLMIRDHIPPVPGTMVAVNAAASAIGRMTIAMLNRAGIRPIAVIRHPRGHPRLAHLDLSAVICGIAGAELRGELATITDGTGPAVVLDAVGGTEGGDLALALRPGGTLVHYGLLSGRPLPAALPARRPDVRIVPFRLRDRIHAADRHERARVLAAVFPLVLDGTAATTVTAIHPLSRIRRALEHDAAPGRSGKILLRMNTH